MESTADTGTRIEIPEGSLMSVECLVVSDVWTRRKELCSAVTASLRFNWQKDVSEQSID